MAPKTLLTLTTAGALFAACSTTTLTVQRYLVSPDNNEAFESGGQEQHQRRNVY
jgi:hypothetical protein